MSDMDANETSFRLAANSAIIQLQNTVVHMQATAKHNEHETRRWKLITRILGVVSVLALATACLAVYNWTRGTDALNQLRTQAIAACEKNNMERQAEVHVWNRALDNFLKLNIQLVISTVAPVQQLEATTVFVRGTEKYLAGQLAPRDCSQAYTTSGNGY